MTAATVDTDARPRPARAAYALEVRMPRTPAHEVVRMMRVNALAVAIHHGDRERALRAPRGPEWLERPRAGDRTPGVGALGRWIARVPALTGETLEGPLERAPETLLLDLGGHDWQAIAAWRIPPGANRGGPKPAPTLRRAIYRLRDDGRLRPNADPHTLRLFDQMLDSGLRKGSVKT